MKETLTTSEIADRLYADKDAGWTYAGTRALAEYLEELERDTGEEIEFDRVAIRCDFSEYASAKECAEEYDFEPEEGATEEDIEQAAMEFLRDKTQVITFNDGVIVQQF